MVNNFGLPSGETQLPADEVVDLDQELHDLQKMWLEARERRKGHLGETFDLQSAPPGVASASSIKSVRKRASDGKQSDKLSKPAGTSQPDDSLSKRGRDKQCEATGAKTLTNKF